MGKTLMLAVMLFASGCMTGDTCINPPARFSAATIDAMTPDERRAYLVELEAYAKICK